MLELFRAGLSGSFLSHQPFPVPLRGLDDRDAATNRYPGACDDKLSPGKNPAEVIYCTAEVIYCTA
jgi:hypothetical protein